MVKFMGINNIDRSVCILTFFGVFQFIILTFVAAIFYPGDYSFFKYYFSDLGAVVARNGEINLISSKLFFVALIVIALSLVPFWLIIRSLFTNSQFERALSTLGSSLGLMSTPFLIGIGILPFDTQLEAHIVVALLFVLFFHLAILLYSIAIVMHHYHPNYLGIIGFLLLVTTIGTFVVSLIYPGTPYGAFLQKIEFYGYTIWALVLVYFAWSKGLVTNRIKTGDEDQNTNISQN